MRVLLVVAVATIVTDIITFRNSIVALADTHEGLAAWVQALGVFFAVLLSKSNFLLLKDESKIMILPGFLARHLLLLFFLFDAPVEISQTGDLNPMPFSYFVRWTNEIHLGMI